MYGPIAIFIENPKSRAANAHFPSALVNIERKSTKLVALSAIDVGHNTCEKQTSPTTVVPE